MDISEEWIRIELEGMHGICMIIGEPDVGKSSFARFLYHRLCGVQETVAFLDGDPGQSYLGPPTTITLACNTPKDSALPPKGRSWRRFIASTSPNGHMLLLVTGAARLISEAARSGVTTVVYDTCGLVSPAMGGLALKYALFDLLQPSTLIAIRSENELEPLLTGLQRLRRNKVFVLEPSLEAKSRSASTRQFYRRQKYREYFEQAQIVRLDWTRYAILPAPRFAIHRLVALEDANGFAIGLGIILSIDRRASIVELLTPIQKQNEVKAIHIGDVLVDPINYNDQLTNR